MTEFYLASADLDVAQPVVFDDDQTAAEFNAYLKRRDGEYGGPSIEFVPDPDEALREPCEVLSLFDGILIVHDRVRDLWSRALAEDSVEWVPARYGDRMWWVLRSRIVIDAVCEEGTLLRRTSSGTVVSIERLTLLRHRCVGHQFFGLAHGFHSWPQVVASQLMEAWSGAGFRSLVFTRLPCV